MYHYASNATRWKKYNGKGDVRMCRPSKGWSATADLIEYHPITGEYLGKSQYWVKETKEG